MCTNPGVLANGQKIACRKCWQCKTAIVNDWVGRCIAESKFSRSATFMTLTYGHDDKYRSADHERAAMLTYSDVQKFIRSLRDAGYPCRYFAVGEYGSKKGRAHWHLLVFWKGKKPDGMVLDTKRVNWGWWPHGHSKFGNVVPETIRYCVKYIQKDLETDKQTYLMMSKKPQLGHDYFVSLARRYVVQYLAPIEPFYSFPDVRDERGDAIRFYMHENTCKVFVRAYLEQWKELHPTIHAPWSEFVEMWADRLLADRKVATDEFIETLRIELAYRRKHTKLEQPWLPVPGGFKPVWLEQVNTWVAYDEQGKPIFWSYDERGERAWTDVIRSESDAELRRESGPKRGGEYQNEYKRQSGREFRNRL